MADSSTPIISLFYLNYKTSDPSKNNKPSAMCKVCKKVIAGHSTTTSNFRRHAETHTKE